MSSEVILSSIVTLVGTVATVGFGFLQWQRTQHRRSREEFRARRIEALGRVWDGLNELEGQVREGARLRAVDAGAKLRADVARTNMLLLGAAPFLEEDELRWASDCIQEIVRIDTLVRSSPRIEPDDDWWATSTRLPRRATGAASAAQRLRDSSDHLGQRYQAVVRGENH